MSAFFESLARRRAALVQRSTRQRGDIAAAVASVRRASAEPLLLGTGIAATVLTSSPKLRGWLVKGWALYAFLRRLFDR